jgi:hypothetical protein
MESPSHEDLLRRNAQLETENAQLKAELALMRQKIDALVRKVLEAPVRSWRRGNWNSSGQTPSWEKAAPPGRRRRPRSKTTRP